MWWNRKNSFERGIGAAEAQTAVAVERLADGIQDRLGSATGEQLAASLRQLASRIDELDLSGQVLRRRRELEKASKKASRQVQRALHDFDKTRGRVVGEAGALASFVGAEAGRTGQQLATLGQKAAPDEPAGWILPSLFGFAFGFAFGFLIARTLRPKPALRSLGSGADRREPGAAEGAA
jgi:hypothetical protein